MVNRFETVACASGNPSFCAEKFCDYSPEGLKALKDIGVNTLFINIAWSRPWMDAVVLEHLVASDRFPLLSTETDIEANLKRFRDRAARAAEAGLKPFGLFGVPHYFDFSKLPESYNVLKGASESTIEGGRSLLCIQTPEVRELYAELIGKLRAQVPELKGMLIYTYDELAEICAEDSDCPHCAGIPETERIPGFLNRLYADQNPAGAEEFEIWWEPWELSAGQTYRILEKLDPRITVSCHTTINEVYYVNQTDIWFRNVAALAKRQGRKMIGEVFIGSSSEDIGPMMGFTCPRLVYDQVESLRRLPAIAGIKEYYGIVPKHISVNEKMFSACLHSDENCNDLLDRLASGYTDDTEKLLEMWECCSEALELIPWDISWALRFGNYLPYDSRYWAKNTFVDLMRTPWMTPSWLSSRRSFYMVVDCPCNYTPTTVRDLRIRFDISIERLDEALNALSSVRLFPSARDEAALWEQAIRLLRIQLVCRLNHMLLSGCAEEIRAAKSMDIERAEALLHNEEANALAELEILSRPAIEYRLEAEEVQRTVGMIRESLRLLRESPKSWADRYYLPKGRQEMTSVLLSL